MPNPALTPIFLDRWVSYAYAQSSAAAVKTRGISLRPYLHVRINKESLFQTVGSKERTFTEHPRYCGYSCIIRR